MDVLLIGGPQFVGRGVIDAALAGGHRITLFNRGRTHPELYPQVEKLRGDRDGGLAALDGRRWDAVIDTCGYVPRVVRQSAQRLRDCADAYLFISSISVYADLVGAREDSPRHVLGDRTVEDVTGATYGGLKALCEDEVVEAFGTRAVIVRPGMIVGAHDGTYRFPWWVGRVAAGGEVLYPAQGRIQLIDALDLGPGMLVLILTVFYSVLGCFLDGISMVVLTMAVVMPTIERAGFDLVWFGIFVVIVVEMAQITPPVGFNLFVLQGMTGHQITYIGWVAFPFFLLMCAMVALLFFVPDLALWLPRKMM